jgi:hypothetical protein
VILEHIQNLFRICHSERLVFGARNLLLAGSITALVSKRFQGALDPKIAIAATAVAYTYRRDV